MPIADTELEREIVARLPRVYVTMGDPSGIGPELVAKLLAEPGIAGQADVMVVGSRREFERACALTGTDPAPAGFRDVPIVGDWAPATVSVAAGRHTLDSLGLAVDAAVAGEADAVCFAPLNKSALRAGGNPYQDELHWFAHRIGYAGFISEINALDEVWTSRVSSHIPMRNTPAMVSADRVVAAIRLLDTAMRDSGRPAPRIAVCAYNPHAGEGGLLGMEEIDTIRPAIEQARAYVERVDGPFPADTIFLKVRAGEYDGVVTMFHDQGQIAMKLIGFDRGVSIQGGLPIPITTCAHGTAFDIAGQGRADVSSLRHAFDLACSLAMRPASEVTRA